MAAEQGYVERLEALMTKWDGRAVIQEGELALLLGVSPQQFRSVLSRSRNRIPKEEILGNAHQGYAFTELAALLLTFRFRTPPATSASVEIIRRWVTSSNR